MFPYPNICTVENYGSWQAILFISKEFLAFPWFWMPALVSIRLKIIFCYDKIKEKNIYKRWRQRFVWPDQFDENSSLFNIFQFSAEEKNVPFYNHYFHHSHFFLRILFSHIQQSETLFWQFPFTAAFFISHFYAHYSPHSFCYFKCILFYHPVSGPVLQKLYGYHYPVEPYFASCNSVRLQVSFHFRPAMAFISPYGACGLSAVCKIFSACGRKKRAFVFLEILMASSRLLLCRIPPCHWS